MHEGHRARMRERFEQSPQSLTEHELLEVFLYAVYPRCNTNEIAHALINSFGSVAGVLSASVSQLKEVKGVGDAAANFIVVSGKLMQRLSEYDGRKKKIVINCLTDIKAFLADRYVGLEHEQLDIILLDKNRCVTMCKTFSEFKKDSVQLDTSAISLFVGKHKPAFALIAHNHTSGNVQPSDCDDEATKALNIIFGIYSVALLDHVIYANGQVYSYFAEGRMKSIIENCSLKVASNYKI